MYASALRFSRFLLVEVPGPWGRSALAESRLDAVVADELATRAERAGTRVVLIRRPGRQRPQPPAAEAPAADGATASDGMHAVGGARAWAIADNTAGAGRICWGSWHDPAELLGLDLSARVAARGPQQVALVCANARRDPCCAVRGRPVAAALAACTSWDTWECSHLGGHRFAANMLLLPSGDIFGRLDPDLAAEALARFEAGQILLSHHRGRCGQPAMVQAALHAAALRLRDARPGALHGAAWRHLPASAVGRSAASTATGSRAAAADIWEVDVAHADLPSGEAVYRVTVVGTLAEPVLLSCADAELKAELHYEAVGFTRLR